MGKGTLRVRARDRVSTVPGRATLPALVAMAVISTTACSNLSDLAGPAVGAPLALVQSAGTSVVLSFDEAITDAAVYAFDADGDGAPDAIFTTEDPAGFGTGAAAIEQAHLDGSALEGSSAPPVSLRVDFPAGATGTLAFGFVLTETSPFFGASVFVYDEHDGLLAATFALTSFSSLPGGGLSTYPEGRISVSFDGVASYATISFSNSTRYYIDNFSGMFGTGGDPLPQPVPSPPPAEPVFDAQGFLPPVGTGAHRVRSTLPLKLRLSADGVAIGSQTELDEVLDALAIPASCPRLALFDAGDEATDLAPLVGANAAGAGSCYRFTDEGQLMYNLKLGPDVFVPGRTYTAGVRIGDQLVLPGNRFFTVF